MPELTSLPGQIMHQPTVDKILQPQEVQPETAVRLAGLATEVMIEDKGRMVQESQQVEQGRVEEERGFRGQEREGRQKPSEPEAKESEAKPETKPALPGCLVDVVV
jgi:hypothetical protein